MKKLLLVLFSFIIFTRWCSANTYVVRDTTNVSADGVSLLWAITEANNNPGRDTILFNIPIRLSYIIPTRGYTITDTIFIDGTSQPGWLGTPIIE